MLFTLEKPKSAKINWKAYSSKEIQNLHAFHQRVSHTEYLYWDKMRYKEPSPKGFAKEELWQIIKFFRSINKIKSAIKSSQGLFFGWNKLNYGEEFFNQFDRQFMQFVGSFFAPTHQKETHQKLMTKAIMEEAIASSQLEGAATSRRVAKKMLQEGRKPVNPDEQMIVNNYLAMQAIEENYKDQPMSIERLLELHHLLTQHTKDSENELPRLRKFFETIYVRNQNKIYYEAPKINFVKKELTRLIKFANDELESEIFIHPVIKAIMLHFWIGYLHPFTDGNGRLARLLFHWYLLKKGYWAIAYAPISKWIKKSPSQYMMAYVYSEQDDFDLTYFIDYHLKRIKLAIDDLKQYIEKQAQNSLLIKKQSEIKYNLNIRQIQLLQYFCQHPEERTALRTHMNINQIARMTAYKDLKELTQKGFLSAHKQGRNIYYYGTEKIKKLF